MYRQAPERFRGMILNDTIAAGAVPAEAGLWQGVGGKLKSSASLHSSIFCCPTC